MDLKPEHQPKRESLQESMRRRTESTYGKPVRSQWRVVERTPNETDDGQYQPSRTVAKAAWMSSRDEAVELMGKMEPKPHSGNTLHIQSRTLYEKWVPAHWERTWL